MSDINYFRMKFKQFKYLKHDEIIERIGGSCGRFQFISYYATMIAFVTEGYLIYNLAFLNLLPEYVCIDALGVGRDCNRYATCTDEFNKNLGVY